MSTVLFLCTGNYYRSRFAEELFNHGAAAADLRWTADSRALAIERGAGNVGAVSPLALAALDVRGVRARGRDRMPIACTPADLDSADLIVALSELEHRCLMLERFPAWADRATYWQVEDIGVTPADVALALVERQIEKLLTVLGEA
jgi:protein-tyrosine-phosphatase